MVKNQVKIVASKCYKSGPLNLIGHFSHDIIGCKTCVSLAWYNLYLYSYNRTKENTRLYQGQN